MQKVYYNILEVNVLVNIGNEWDTLLAPEFKKDYYLKLREFLKYEYSNFNVYPAMENIFNALRYTSYSDVKAVILGQDPYHGFGQAHGLCFSVQKGVEPPPSLKNIFTELHNDLGIKIPSSGDLTAWAKNGVLLLNTVLTVREGMANSHRNMGWEILTDKIISLLNQREKPMVFILWGSPAKSKIPLVTNKQHKVLTAVHPSPLSVYRGFFGCRHFSETNQFLIDNKIQPINWNLF